MDTPADRRYAHSHEWAKPEEDRIRVGLTAYALEQLGDIVYLDLPASGAEIAQGEPFGAIESVKAASDLYAPVSGKIVAVNEELMDNLDALADDPWEDGWMILLEPSSPEEIEELMDAATYAALCEAGA
jgi:glycine cleavage system H protein